WSALGSGMDNGVKALAVLGTNLYAGGWFTNASGTAANYIAQWDGSSWSALGSGLVSQSAPGSGPGVNALAVSGNDLYAAGQFATADGNPANSIAKWDGSNWSALGSGVTFVDGSPGKVWALAVSGTNLYVGGVGNFWDGSEVTNIAKWDGNSWSALG